MEENVKPVNVEVTELNSNGMEENLEVEVTTDVKAS